jgi:hypothetical protein
MKKRFLFLFTFLVAIAAGVKAQTVIWSEGFNSMTNWNWSLVGGQGSWSTATEMNGVTPYEGSRFAYLRGGLLKRDAVDLNSYDVTTLKFHYINKINGNTSQFQVLYTTYNKNTGRTGTWYPLWHSQDISNEAWTEVSVVVPKWPGSSTVIAFSLLSGSGVALDDVKLFEGVQIPQPDYGTAVSADDGYFDDFEGDVAWKFINGYCPNAWCVGSATSTNDGGKSMYISNDGGTTYGYNTSIQSTTYAAKLFSFQGGDYTFSFDWKCYGQNNYDYDNLSVYLVPSETKLVPDMTGYYKSFGMSINDWILIKDNLYNKSDWQKESAKVTVPAGNYMVVFKWENSTSSNGTIPAAIDNFRIGEEPIPSETIEKTECDSYTWLENGIGDGNTYTTSGNYTWNQTDTEGTVIKKYTLNLTINNSTSETRTATVTIGQHYTDEAWPNLIDFDVTDDTKATQYFTTTNAAGCDHVITLNLTINEPVLGFAGTVNRKLKKAEAGAAVTVVMEKDEEMETAIIVPQGKTLTINGANYKLTLGDETNFLLNDNLTLKDVKIDAAALTLPLIALAAEPAEGTKKNQDVYTDAATTDFNLLNAVTIDNIIVKDLKNSFISSNGQDWALENFTLTKSIIQLDDADKNFIAFDKTKNNKGAIKNLTISENTIYNINSTSKAYFIRYANASNAAKAFGTNNGTSTFAYKLTKNTIINTFKEQNFGNNTPNNAKTMMEGTQNIYVDLKQPSKFFQGNCTKTIADNVSWGGTEEATMSLSTVAAFATPTAVIDLAAENGGIDLKVDNRSKAAKLQAGDPRWLVDYVPTYLDVNITASDNGTVTANPTQVEEGDRVTLTVTPDSGYELEELTVTDGAGNTIDLAADNSFIMPATAVTVTATFKLSIVIPDMVTSPIEREVKGGTKEEPTDLTAIMADEKQYSPNPAYINLKLGEGYFRLTEPLASGTTITLEGDSEEWSVILPPETGALLEMDKNHPCQKADGNGFFSTNKVTLKNLYVMGLNGALFTTNGRQYLIDYLTVDNCYVAMTPGQTLFDFENGGVVGDLKLTNSTVWTFGPVMGAPHRGAPSGVVLYSAEGSQTPLDAEIQKQRFLIAHNTLQGTETLKHAAGTDMQKVKIDANHNIVIGAPDFTRNLNAGTNLLVQYNAFVNEPVAADPEADYKRAASVAAAEEAAGATACIVEDAVFMNTKEFGNFSLASCPAKDMRVGDPRWLLAWRIIQEDEFGPGTVAQDDLSYIVNTGLEKGYNIFVLPEPADDEPYLYLKSLHSIKADKPLVIRSNPKVRVNAAFNADPFIVLSKDPEVKAVNDYYRISKIELNGLWVICLRNSVLWDQNVKYCVEDLKLKNSVLSMTPLPGDIDGMPERLRTKDCKNESVIAFQAGGAKDITVINSTVCDNKDKAVAKYFIRFNNAARLDRYGFDKDHDTHNMTYKNNTFYGMLNADGQWANYSAISGQNYVKFDIQKNIWYNCGKDIIRRLSGGRIGDGASVKFFQNTYVNNGEILDESGYDKSETQLNSMPKFKFEVTQVYTPDYFHYDDYTLCTSSEQLFYKTGDPRWFENGGFADGYHWNPVTGQPEADSREGDANAIEAVETNKADGEWYTIQGVRVDKPAKGLYIHNGRKVVVK